MISMITRYMIMNKVKFNAFNKKKCLFKFKWNSIITSKNAHGNNDDL